MAERADQTEKPNTTATVTANFTAHEQENREPAIAGSVAQNVGTGHTTSADSNPHRRWPPQPYVEDAPDSDEESKSPNSGKPKAPRTWPPQPSVEDVADYEEPSRVGKKLQGLRESIHNPERKVPR